MLIDKCIHKSNFNADQVFEMLPDIPKTDIVKRIETIRGYQKQLGKLLKIKKIEQKSPEWYEARHTMISASDFAQALNEGKFGTQRDLIIKKVDPPEYGVLNNPFFEWGNKFEQVASDIYAKMHEVKIYEFGLIKHPRVSFLGASPDGITENGIMLEIKCPLKRKIGGEVPTQYYYQIQGQLDVCDLEECDYFECEFALCKSVWEFEASKMTKGVFSKNDDGTYEYGPLVLSDDNQNLYEIEQFIENHKNINYWILKAYNLRPVRRDKTFISEKLAELKEVWDKIVYYRDNREAYKMEILNEIEIQTEVYNQVKLKPYAFISC